MNVKRYTLQTQDDNGDDCEPYIERDSVGELVNFEDYEALMIAAKNLLFVIEAHEIDSLDCDRRGTKYCSCLSDQIKRVERLLAPKCPICNSAELRANNSGDRPETINDVFCNDCHHEFRLEKPL